MNLSQYVLEPLRMDEEFVLYRAEHSSQRGLPSVLVLAPASKHPPLATLKKIEHEFSLRHELDSAWAVRPLALCEQRGRTVLALEDPGGDPLEKSLSGPMEVAQFLRVAIGLATALGGMHGRRLIHKDVKPANALINPATGQIRLMGFGIASRSPSERQAPQPPETIAGTLAYMAPEQTGRMNRSVDARSDLYALGITLYEMLTGSVPFSAADPMEWVHCHIARQPAPPTERVKHVPAPVSAIVMKLLAKTAEERYQTAAGLERDLRRCLAQFEDEGRIDDFAPGEHDTPARLLIPGKLYGRAREIESLLAAFDRIVKGGPPELVLVSGYSGIGKSSVVNELHKVLVPPRGLFAAGKFDQHTRDIPYSTLAQAFQDLVRPLLGKSEGELARWCDAFKEALGPNGQLIVDLVPELKLIVGDQAPVPELAPQDAQRRFQLVFRRFLAAFARAEHPLALFLDDLQWLDTATLDLLEDLLTQPDIRHLLLIGAYRDNEVTSTHPLMRRLETSRNGGALVREIVLTPLTGEDVSRLIADSLYCDREGARPLAQLVLEKTDGNPFFVIQFLSTIIEDGLLTFDHGAGRWSWDLTRIHAEGYTDNVVDLMAGKLSRLPHSTQEALKELACLGNSAEASLLAIVRGTSKEELHSDLWEALRLELIVHSEHRYRFVHDRVQEAAYSLILEEQRAPAHLRIGRFLASHIEPGQRDEAVFEIVGHFNRAAALVTSEEERDQVAALNLVAGKRAKKAVAFASALSYLTAGSALVAGDGWQRRHDLVFELELHRAECEFLTGDMSAAEQHLRILSSLAADTVQRAAVACLLVDVHWALQQPDRGLAECLECLRHAGLEIPRHPTKAQAQAEYDRICSKLDGVGVDELAELPLLTDPTTRAILDVTAKVAPTAAITDMNLLSVLICAAVGLGLQRGHCDSSCFAYEYLGVIAGWHFGDFEGSFRFGLLGHELVARKGLRRFESFVSLIFSSVIMPWARPIASCRELLRTTFEVANKNGDRHSAVCCRTELVSSLLWSGEPLVEAQTEADAAVEFCRRAAFRDYIDRAVIQAAFIRNLRGLTRQFGSLDDEQFNELRMQTHFESQPHLVACEFWYWVTKLQARYLAGNHAAAIDASIRAEGLFAESRRRGQLCACEAFRVESEFYCALAHAAACDSASGEEGRQHVNAAAGHLQELELWARHCPENFENRAALVAAELARIEGRDRDATQLYEQAIRSARENGFVHHEALALELAAQFYAARGFDRIAKAYLRDARSGYRQWGADGKVRQLEAQYPHLADEQPSSDPTRTVLTPVEHLDLSTLLKLSQAVQAETDLNTLIAAVMRLGLEHAGAERGLLLLPRSDGYRIEAEARSSSEAVTVDLRQSSIGAGDLPQSVLQYVLRTRERVLVQDAAATSEFAGDVYLRQHHVRSVLCIPLLKQTRLVGIIYLENNLTSGAFTAARMALLEVLAAHAAISLENALLYRDLQERERESRLIVDSIPGLVATLTPAGEVEAVTAQVLAYCGRTLEELKQWGTGDTVHPDDLPRAIEIVSDSLKSGDPYEILERIRRFDGVYRWFQVRGLPLRDSNGSIVRWYALLTDIDDLKRAEALLDGEKRLLEMVASGSPLEDVLETMCGFVDTVVSHCACSILLVDSNGKFRHGAGPTLPPGYEGTVNGAPVVCEAGPCGTAASLKEQVIVPELASDQRWVGLAWRTLVLAHGLRSVCSTPIVSSTGKVLGTFAIYRREPEPPTALLTDLIARFTNVASIAIERTISYHDLQERERESRMIVNSIPGMVALLTPGGDVEVVNPQLIEYFGQTIGQLRHWRMTDTIHPEDLPHVIEVFTRAIASGSPYEIVQRFRRSDGVYRWFLNCGLPVRDPSGQIARWCVLLTDIDERQRVEEALRKSERQFRLLVETIPALVWRGTPEGELDFLNERAVEYLGLTVESLTGERWLQLVHPDHREATVRRWLLSITTGSSYDDVYRLRRADGEYRWIQSVGEPFRDTEGRITHWYGLVIDIEDRKRAEAELRALKDQLYKENLVLRDEVDRTSMFEEIVGTSPALQPVLARVAKVALTDATVLITGETGTGKELVARAIHRRSARGSRAFVSVNCAAVPRELIASELFGHEKGAFTGATQRRLGRFELAHGGTIFLDEVGDLPMETQVALLRVLQEREFERVGGSASVRVDVRVVAATNRDLQAAIDAGTFRSDLFYRLNVFPIAVPALRERADDIPLLVEYFIDRYARKAGKTIRRVNKRTLDRLRSYQWPGNVRELQNVIERSVIVCDSDEFTVDESWLSGRPAIEGRLALSGTVAAHEKAVIEDALRACGGRVFGPSGAATRLGIARSTLESKIRGFSIDKNRFRSRRTKSPLPPK